jgi:hypothetical protein
LIIIAISPANHHQRILVASLNRNLNRRLDRYATRMLNGARRPAPPNYLSIACRLLATYIRLRKRDIRKEAVRQCKCRPLLEREAWEKQWSAALNKVYGPDAAS